MTTIKSREFECPQELMVAMVNLEIMKRSLNRLATQMHHQADFFNDDVATAVISQSAEELENQLHHVDDMKNELAAFLTTLN
jgi:hypothetical protein